MFLLTSRHPGAHPYLTELLLKTPKDQGQVVGPGADRQRPQAVGILRLAEDLSQSVRARGLTAPYPWPPACWSPLKALESSHLHFSLLGVS